MPHEATELVLLCEDPDASGTTLLHWLVTGIDPGTTGAAEGQKPQGRAPREESVAEALKAGSTSMAGRPPIDSGPAGTPRRRPRRLYADRGYDFGKYRRLPWKRGIKPMIASGVAHGSGLGKVRWVVERAFAWLHPCGSACAASDALISFKPCSN